ncbi:MAG TPA: uroporphyrinogen decarboxylase family protein [Armatimonadota bacterium]|nr:uroporphyrinogen decarboxylase family protein [Armatimonadota bacterium]
MIAKDRMMRVLSGETISAPAVLHSWGDYKVELAGFHPKFQYYQGGPELAGIERNFYERFKPDWIHLGSAGWKGFWNRPRKVEDGQAFIRNADDSKWIRIRDDYQLDVPWIDQVPKLRLTSKSEIDDYFAASPCTADDILRSGRFEHMEIIAREYGDRVLIAINDGAAGCHLSDHSFEETMVACHEKPDLVSHYIFKACERFLTDVRAAKECGAHAYIFSEGFGGSLDLLSPEMHERLEGDTKRWFYAEVRKAGMLGIGYWLGDVRPNMELINSLDMAALMIEESKKGFVLDPVEIRKTLRPEVCLIGNADSLLLKRGPPDQIREEVRRQKKVADFGPFVIANGSPLIIGTPPENVDVFLTEARA